MLAQERPSTDIDVVEVPVVSELDETPQIPLEKPEVTERRLGLRQRNTFPYHVGHAMLNGTEIQLPLF